MKDVCSQQASDVTGQIRKRRSLGVVVTGLGWPKNIYLRAQHRLLRKSVVNQKGSPSVSFQSPVIVLCSAERIIGDEISRINGNKPFCSSLWLLFVSLTNNFQIVRWQCCLRIGGCKRIITLFLASSSDNTSLVV